MFKSIKLFSAGLLCSAALITAPVHAQQAADAVSPEGQTKAAIAAKEARQPVSAQN